MPRLSRLFQLRNARRRATCSRRNKCSGYIYMNTQFNFRLDELMTLESAAQRWPQLFTAIELRRAARAGQIRHIHKGRKRLISERDLMDWLHQKETGPSCQRTSSSKLPGNGLHELKEGLPSITSGMIPDQEKFVAEVLEQRISKKPNGS